MDVDGSTEHVAISHGEGSVHVPTGSVQHPGFSRASECGTSITSAPFDSSTGVSHRVVLLVSCVLIVSTSIGIILGVSFSCRIPVWAVDLGVVILAASACTSTAATLHLPHKSRKWRLVASLTITIGCMLLLTALCFLLFWEHHYTRRWDHAIFGYATCDRDPFDRPVKRICFIGDSLISYTDRDYQLVHKLTDSLREARPSLHFESIETGVGGDTIANIKERFQRDCLDHSPDSILLYWQTDADGNNSNVAQYTNDLHEVLATMSAAVQPGHVMIAGPTLFGELPRGENPNDALFETYVDMNARLAGEYNATYANTRDAFFSILGDGMHWRRSSGGLTKSDRMHHNFYGAAVVEAIFRGLLFDLYNA